MQTTIPEPDAAGQAHSARLARRVREEIAAAGGFLPFERFMELALYAPGLGYYVAGAHKFGAGGDFVTAPELSPLFSRCLARQCAEVLAGFERSACLLELGGGSGRMAADLLAELERLEALPDHYYLLEPSPELQARQRATLAEAVPHLLGSVRWLERLDGLALHGVVLANEVADALPVQRFRQRESGLFELGVAEVDGALASAERPADPALAARVAALRRGLPDWPLPYTSELCPRLGPWLAALAEAVAQGVLLFIDYGYPRAEYYHPQRQDGTLLCHYRHRALDDPLARLGLQDITASVDFTALAEAGTAAGLTLAGYTTQAHFLLANGLEALFLAEAGDDPRRQLALARQIKLLTLPSEMGERFQVMAFQKGLDSPLRGFALRDLRHRL